LAGLSSISQSFVLPAVVGGSPVSSYQLTVSFRSVFDGRDALTFHDVFSVVLDGTVLLSQDSSALPEWRPVFPFRESGEDLQDPSQKGRRRHGHPCQ
jgi:hypothetical protein